MFQGVSPLNCFWVCVPGCKVPELFVGVCPKYVGSWTWLRLCVAVNEVSVHGCMWQRVTYLNSVCARDHKVSDLCGCVFPSRRDFLFACGYIFQGVHSLIYSGVRFLLCSRVYGLMVERSLIHLGVYIPGYEASDLFVVVCLRM